MTKQINVTYTGGIGVEVEDTDTLDQVLDKVRAAIAELHYPAPYEQKFLEFVIQQCDQMPELEDEILD